MFGTQMFKPMKGALQNCGVGDYQVVSNLGEHLLAFGPIKKNILVSEAAPFCMETNIQLSWESLAMERNSSTQVLIGLDTHLL